MIIRSLSLSLSLSIQLTNWIMIDWNTEISPLSAHLSLFRFLARSLSCECGQVASFQKEHSVHANATNVYSKSTRVGSAVKIQLHYSNIHHFPSIFFRFTSACRLRLLHDGDFCCLCVSDISLLMLSRQTAAVFNVFKKLNRYFVACGGSSAESRRK